jgi:hypothetical protein
VSQAMLPRFPLYQAMLLAREEYDPENLQFVSTRKIYRGRAEDVIPSPKIQEKNPTIDCLGLVFPRLHYTILEAEPRDILYTLIHDIHYTRERMFLQRRAQDACCPLPECRGVVQDRKHLFTSCYLVSEA